MICLAIQCCTGQVCILYCKQAKTFFTFTSLALSTHKQSSCRPSVHCNIVSQIIIEIKIRKLSNHKIQSFLWERINETLSPFETSIRVGQLLIFCNIPQCEDLHSILIEESCASTIGSSGMGVVECQTSSAKCPYGSILRPGKDKGVSVPVHVDSSHETVLDDFSFFDWLSCKCACTTQYTRCNVHFGAIHQTMRTLFRCCRFVDKIGMR